MAQLPSSSSSSSSGSDLARELVVRGRGEVSTNRLEFDVKTGELVVRRAEDPRDPDATVIDQIASDGFA